MAMGSNICNYIDSCVLDYNLEVNFLFLSSENNSLFQFEERMYKEKGSLHFTIFGRYDNEATLEKAQKYLARTAEIH
jgi:hypothetical protein